MEPVSYLRAVLALIFVVALIALIAWAARRWLASGGNFATMKVKDSTRRLQMVEQFYFEPKRRLVLMRCDDEEHLILLGHQRETLIRSRAICNAPAREKEKA
jgi:flagellar protein FliO/FliZ